MNISNLIIDALVKDAQAKEEKSLAILQNYFENSACIGEHPDIIEECSKQIKDLAEARESIAILSALTQQGENKDGQ